MSPTQPPPTPTCPVSVVIPTHERRALLERAVQSVCAQTSPPKEIIIIDDASATPVDPAWFASHHTQIAIQVERNPRTTGPAQARNQGIALATGDWIAFLDDDDTWEPTKLYRQIEALSAVEDSNIKAASCQMTLRGTDLAPHRKTAFPTSKQEIIAGLIFSDENLNPSTLLVHKQVFVDIGGFDPSLPTAEDRQWLLRYLTRFDVVVVDEPLTNYTQHTGATLTKNFDAMLEGEKQFAAFVQNHTQQLGVDYHTAMAYRLAKLGNEYLLAKQWRQGVREFLKAIKTHPLEYRAWAGFAIALLGPATYRRIMAMHMPRVRLASGNDQTPTSTNTAAIRTSRSRNRP